MYVKREVDRTYNKFIKATMIFYAMLVKANDFWLFKYALTSLCPIEYLDPYKKQNRKASKNNTNAFIYFTHITSGPRTRSRLWPGRPSSNNRCCNSKIGECIKV